MADYFGDATDPEKAPRLKVKWPLRPLNMIEGELNVAMAEAMLMTEENAPAIFIDDDEFGNADEWAALYGEKLTVQEAIALQAIVSGEVQERFRRQLIVARELADSATWKLYLIACEVEGIEPIVKGPSK